MTDTTTEPIYGVVLAVTTTNAGADLTAPVAPGAVTLPVSDASVFSSEGGQILINSAVLSYTGINPDTDEIALFAPLPGAAEEGERVNVYPEAPVKEALVNLGDEGDGISVIVPNYLAPLLADGFRETANQENVLVAERAAGEYTVVDIVGHPSLVAGDHLRTGEIDPDKLAVGVVTNLISDPTFLGGGWEDGDEWEISVDATGPYAGIGYMRSTTTGPHPITSPYASERDNIYFLTPWNDVDSDRVIRLSCIVRGDNLSRSNTWTSSTRARMRILFRGPNVPDLSGAGQIMEVVLIDSTDPDVWYPLAETFSVPDGYTSFRVMLDSAYQTQGAIDYIKPEVQVLWNRLQSANYVEGQTGFLFGDEDAQVQNLNVTDTIGATNISAESLEVAGVNLYDMVDALPKGVAGGKYARSWGTSTAEIGTTGVITHQFDAGDVVHGRIYRIHVHGHIGTTGDTSNEAAYDLQLNYTTDGSTPLVTGGTTGVLDASLTRVNTGPQGSNSFNVFAYYVPGGSYSITKYALVMKRVIGTGTGSIYLPDVNRCTEFLMEDMGRATGVSVANGGGGVLSQKSKAGASPPPPDPDPVVTTTKSWYATWTRSYDSDNGTRQGDDTTDMYQGYISGTHGNTRSLAGFDYANIQATLAGATINKITVTYKMKHAWASSGITWYVGTHNYTSKPSTWGSGNVTERRHSYGSQKAGVTYTQTLSNTIGNEFKAGTTRGIAFGPAPSNSASAYYGYAYGGTSSSSRPKITITYTK